MVSDYRFMGAIILFAMVGQENPNDAGTSEFSVPCRIVSAFLSWFIWPVFPALMIYGVLKEKT
jgi:hypothetical protein